MLHIFLNVEMLTSLKCTVFSLEVSVFEVNFNNQIIKVCFLELGHAVKEVSHYDFSYFKLHAFCPAL